MRGHWRESVFHCETGKFHENYGFGLVICMLTMCNISTSPTSVDNSVTGRDESVMWVFRDRMVFEVVNQVRKSHKALVSPRDFVEARIFSLNREMYNASWVL